MATYNQASPWHNTQIKNNEYLDILAIRPIPADSDDYVYTVEEQYTHRPDLLAYDLYGTISLWWVFAQRNMDVIKDPIFDLVAGVKIFLPKKRHLTTYLGL